MQNRVTLLTILSLVRETACAPDVVAAILYQEPVDTLTVYAGHDKLLPHLKSKIPAPTVNDARNVIADMKCLAPGRLRRR